MSEKGSSVEKELRRLEDRMERIESLLEQRVEERAMENVKDLFRWQQQITRIDGFDIWSIILAKKFGTDELMMGTCAHLSHETYLDKEYGRKFPEHDQEMLPKTHSRCSPEEQASLADALSHPARVFILRECKEEPKYPSDLEKRVTAKYGALYHHINSLIEGNLVTQEKERGKYVITSAGKTALLFLNVLASVIDVVKATGRDEVETEQKAHISGSGSSHQKRRKQSRSI